MRAGQVFNEGSLSGIDPLVDRLVTDEKLVLVVSFESAGDDLGRPAAPNPFANTLLKDPVGLETGGLEVVFVPSFQGFILS